MFTTCPNCTLTLGVTATDLRVGQGYVRCGRCVSVFNALLSLADEDEADTDDVRVEVSAAATQSRPIPEVLKQLARDREIADREDAAATSAETDETSPGDLPVVADTNDQATGTFETIVLEGDTILQTEEFVDEAEVDERLKALAEQLGGPPLVEERPADPDLETSLPRRKPVFEFEPAPPPPAEEAWLPETPRARIPQRAWTIGAAVLAVLLGLQAVHHWRAPIAGRVPLLGSLYSAVGAPIAPPWDVAAYDVRQLGAAADPADSRRIEVRASVRNGATRQQPAPLLRVVLQDRFGNELARQELAPGQYLRGSTVTMLAADQRIDASLLVDDPEQKAVGFELDACLPRADGRGVHCATDAGVQARR